MDSRKNSYQDRLVEHQGKLFYLRFSLSERVQHIVLMICFTALMLTGIPLLFPETWVVKRMFWFEGSFTLRGIIHRVAAVGLITLAASHVFYCLFSARGNRVLRDMILKWDDFLDPFRMIFYYLGRRAEPPSFARFNFIEKFEYYAVVWGSVIMIGSGVALWFPVQATLLFPRWVLDIIRVIHSYEAVLAFLSIIIWHMYIVHFNPEVFPMSWIWWDGRMSLEFFRDHYRLEFERMMAELPLETALRVREQLGEKST
jgi:cytochrome b subunit of formate dehydrogenase